MATSYVRVPPDSTGKKVFSKEHVIGADTVQTQVIHVADSTDPTQALAINATGAASVTFAEGQPTMSGFGSLKTSSERVLGVYESSLDTYEALFSTVTANGGVSNYTPSESSQVLLVNSTSGSRSMIMTNRYHYYTPGTSSLFKMTVSCGDAGKVGNIRRWGAFDQNDGIFFELYETTVNVVIRSSTSGSVVENRVAQSAWNHDKLNGTGLSSHTLNITGINVFWMDYQWLGAGRVRFGIYTPDGSRVVCHQFENAGLNSLPYMRTGTLPAALENVNTASTGASSELRSVCIGVYTEGTYEDYAFWRFSDVDRNITGVTTNTVAFSIRTLSTFNGKHNHVVVYPETLNVWCDQPVAVTMWQATSVTGGTWDALASTCEVNYTGTVDTTGSQKFKTLYFNTGAEAFDLDKFFEKNDEGILTSATGVPEVWSFLVTKLTAASTNASLNLGYKELW
jgi:hypothetical protein